MESPEHQAGDPLGWQDKLFGLLERHFGKFTAVLVGKGRTSASVHEIEKISDAIARVNGGPVEVTYEGGNVKVMPASSDAESLDYGEVRALPIDERAQLVASERVATRDLVTAANAGAAIAGAARLLEERTGEGRTANSESLDPQFEATYVDITGRIYDPEVRALWTRLLADEVEQPGRFSLRTLRTLETMTPSEADTFERVARRRFVPASAILDPASGGRAMILESGGPSLDDIDILVTLGLLSPSLMGVGLEASSSATNLPLATVYLFGDLAVLAGPGPTVPSISVKGFTRVGHEIASLVDPVPVESDALRLAESLSKTGRKVGVYSGASALPGLNPGESQVMWREMIKTYNGDPTERESTEGA